MKGTLKEYMELPYTTQIIKNSDGSYFGSIKELPGCMTEGATQEEVLFMIEDAKEAWIETAIENKMEIPLPDNLENKEYSGKYLIRTGKELHKKLSENAAKSGISLNTYSVMLLSERNTQFSMILSLFNQISSIQSFILKTGEWRIAKPLKESEYSITRWMEKKPKLIIRGCQYG